MNFDNPIVLLWNAISCIIFLYYSSSTLEYKTSQKRSTIISIVCYLAYCILCFLNSKTLNVIGFVIINFIILYSAFKESIFTSIVKTVILTAFMMFGELIIATLIFNRTVTASWTICEDLIVMMLSKMIYFLLVIIFKRLSKHQPYHKSYDFLYILILPFSTCIFFIIFNKVFPFSDSDTKIMLYIFSILLIISNFVVYIVYDKNIDQHTKISQLQSLKNKKEFDYKSYQLIKEKYTKLKVMIHDFDKYCNNIESMLEQKHIDIPPQLQKIKNKNKEFLLVEYTDNLTLNILLSQKMIECNNHNIDFQVYIENVSLSFIDEMDTVAIFANLLDNAIESCLSSKNPKIYLNVHKMNNSFIVISVDNSSDISPIIKNGHLQTRKVDTSIHGLGTISIEQSIKNYNGHMKFTHNREIRVFNTTILISFIQKSLNINR